MDLKKQLILENKSYIAKLYTECWGNYDLTLFDKYYEPTVDIGGTFTTNYETFTVENANWYVRSNSPISKTFSTVQLGISYEYAGARARVWADEIGIRIGTAMNTLRALDGTTNVETIEYSVI